MIVYVESSAVIPLVRSEKTSETVREYLEDLRIDQNHIISARLLETELRRAAHRLDINQGLVTETLKRFDIIEMTTNMFQAAGRLEGTHLRSLDALHLATALAANASAMITLDQRLEQACAEVGLPVLDINIPREYVTT